MVAWLALVLGIINFGVILWFRVPIWSDEKRRIRERRDEERLRRQLERVLPSNLLRRLDGPTTDDE